MRRCAYRPDAQDAPTPEIDHRSSLETKDDGPPIADHTGSYPVVLGLNAVELVQLRSHFSSCFNLRSVH